MVGSLRSLAFKSEDGLDSPFATVQPRLRRCAGGRSRLGRFVVCRTGHLIPLLIAEETRWELRV